MPIFDSLMRFMERGVALKEEALTQEAIAPALRDQLLQFSPTIVVHRGGNGPSRLRRSVEAGARSVEVDVRWRAGSLVIGHEHWLGPVAYDKTRWLLKLDRVTPPVEVFLDAIAEVDCVAMLDLKLGSPSQAGLLLEAVRQRSLTSRAWFTGNWIALDAVGSIDPATKRYYGDVSNASRLQRFLTEQADRGRGGISMERRFVTAESVEDLHRTGVDVLAYTVTDAAEGLGLLQAGVDGLITNNLSLVELYASKA